MHARLFALVSKENELEVFAFGMQLWQEDRTDAVIFRVDPRNGQTTTGIHESAESALKRWGRLAPMELRWESAEHGVLEMVTNVAPCAPGPLPELSPLNRPPTARTCSARPSPRRSKP